MTEDKIIVQQFCKFANRIIDNIRVASLSDRPYEIEKLFYLFGSRIGRKMLKNNTRLFDIIQSKMHMFRKIYPLQCDRWEQIINGKKL